jgi:energy-coupling factor transporter ATP-binding protein EcfA2
MFLRQALIRNVRSIARLQWRPAEEGPGWHVILGDNGAGKSSFLRSLALALLGPTEALAARQDWNTWLRTGEDSGSVDITIVPDAKYDLFSGKGRASYSKPLDAAVGLDRVQQTGKEVELRSRIRGSAVSPERHVWGTGTGWFSAAFGPFRRFHGRGQGCGAELPVKSKTRSAHFRIRRKHCAH